MPPLMFTREGFDPQPYGLWHICDPVFGTDLRRALTSSSLKAYLHSGGCERAMVENPSKFVWLLLRTHQNVWFSSWSSFKTTKVHQLTWNLTAGPGRPCLKGLFKTTNVPPMNILPAGPFFKGLFKTTKVPPMNMEFDSVLKGTGSHSSGFM